MRYTHGGTPEKTTKRGALLLPTVARGEGKGFGLIPASPSLPAWRGLESRGQADSRYELEADLARVTAMAWIDGHGGHASSAFYLMNLSV